MIDESSNRRTQQPSGTVTFLFTDIVGSTQLLQKLGAARYRAARQEHCDLLRAAFGRHGGYEVDCEGDSFFVAFAAASEAVVAAEEVQRALRAHVWPEKSEFRVRIA
jgi:class 3 adenylate cyclase